MTRAIVTYKKDLSVFFLQLQESRRRVFKEWTPRKGQFSVYFF